ncbi:LacI family DNA-binding transcriptional regulator [Clostridium sediminicola]|uniref:LacI family DNA-binding transcriptional regulator n=1 Tax=Clostridium sediminicola TaxID=3114879 RepID=UPI0031F26F80
MPSLTIRDIAKLAGVSKSTVSRVLNNTGYVNVDTRRKIEKVIEENDYTPSATARSLSKQETNVIGVIIPEADNPFFGEILKGISDVADKNSLSIIFCNTNNDEEKEKNALRMLKEQRIKGVILTPATDEKLIQFDSHNKEFIGLVNALEVPVVLLDRDIDYNDWDGIFIDNKKGAFDAVNVLIKAGHKKIATITGDLKLKIGRERLEGYKEAFKHHCMEIDERYIFEGDFTTDTAYKLAKRIINMEEPPTAVFTSNNLSNLGFLKAIFETGLRIPEDIAFVGFDNVPLVDIFNINLSVVDRDTEKMGRMAMELLMKRLNDSNDEANSVIISPKLILKGSEKKCE